ncbi:MAG: gamma-glutamylcyclotransferase [Rhodobacterales bacterium]|nr:gamma-glutamylcyclotransferase [Rhodobacterales bacterium]
MPRQMQLTPDLVARVPPHDGMSGLVSTRSDRPTDDDYAAVVAGLRSQGPASGEVWIFAYGSLIWNPEFDFDTECLGTLSGWHRSFCLGWVRIYRGTPERPGIMLALDRGGSCRGVVFRLPQVAIDENLTRILRREMPIKRDKPPCRWVTVRTDAGPVRAIAFPISRSSPAYLPDLTEEMVVQALATAAGERGSMAEYLASTVEHLEARGIHDRYLWRMQALVAERIAALYPGP